MHSISMPRYYHFHVTLFDNAPSIFFLFLRQEVATLALQGSSATVELYMIVLLAFHSLPIASKPTKELLTPVKSSGET